MAFCNKCGAQLLDDAVFCTNCGSSVAAQPQPQYQAPQQQYAPQPQYQPQYQTQYQAPQPQQSTGVYGLGKSIASAIIGFFALVFAIVSTEMVALAELYYYSYNYSYSYAEECAIMGVVFAIFAIPLCILSIIFGAKSINNYKYAKRQLGTNPIATLIIGISGLSMGAIGAICTLVGFFGSASYLYL